MLTCDCEDCDDSIAEIKCPYSIAHTKPSAANLGCLEEINGVTKLKRSSSYYTQIQGQLGITNRKTAWFFVYTHHGEVLEKIDFDPIEWERLKDLLVYFWYNYLAPSILGLDV